MQIEMTVLCNTLSDAALIEEVVKGTASTYSIRTLNGEKAKKTVTYVGGKKKKDIGGKECIIQFAKQSGGKFHMDGLIKHGEKLQFAPSTMSSKVSLLVKEGRLKLGEKPHTYQFVK